MYFNRRHDRAGHLFQGRFKAILVDADSYVGVLSRYIHLNPVHAGIAALPDDYAWSSYGAYVGKTSCPQWLTTAWLLNYFSADPNAAKTAFRAFTKASIDEPGSDPLLESAGTLILGQDDFIKSVRAKHLDGKKSHRDLPALNKLTKQSLHDIVETCRHEFGNNAKLAKKTAVFLCHRFSSIPLKEIGNEFKIR